MKYRLMMLLACAVLKVHSQTADEIIQKYAAAMGGLENFKAIKTLKMTGTVDVQGNQLPLTVQVINGRAVRTDVQAMDKNVVTAYKDGAGWKINPFQGLETATDISGTELNDVKMQSFIANQLMDYKNRGCTVELQGQEDVGGTKAFKIQLVADDKRTSYYYIDPTSYMLIKSVGTRTIQGQDIEVENDYSDVKDFNGLKFSMSRVQKTNGQTFQEIHFDKIELNVPVDEKIFDKG